MKETVNRDAASITYALAQTRLNIGLDLVLESCNTTPQIEPSLTMAPAVTAGSERYHVAGQMLASGRQKRDLTVQLHDNGTIKSVNSTTSDRTLAIVGNFLKFATSVAKAGIFSTADRLSLCNVPTESAITRLKVLQQRMIELAMNLDSATDSAQINALHSARNAIASEIAALRSGPLRLELRTTLNLPARAAAQNLEAPPSDTVRWSAAPFMKWARNDEAAKSMAEAFGFLVSYAVPAKKDDLANKRPSSEAYNLLQPDESEPSCGALPCVSLVLREPVRAIAVASPLVDKRWPTFDATERTQLLSTVTPVAQWGHKTYLVIPVRVGDSRTVKLDLDAYGRKQNFSWSSEARAETILGGLAQATDALTGLRAALKDPDPTELQLQLAKITELEALQKYNRLIKCEEILRAGGYVCPP